MANLKKKKKQLVENSLGKLNSNIQNVLKTKTPV